MRPPADVQAPKRQGKRPDEKQFSLDLGETDPEVAAMRQRLEAAEWKADQRRFTGEGPTGFGAL
ncbi:MAG: hypothetical protein ABIR79_16525 [Candidatus Binatia bacterium]